MGDREFHYRWEFALRSSPEQLWPLVADTNRFNRDTGVPAIQVQDSGALQTGRSAHGRRRLRLSKFGVPVEWEEQPFEWIRPSRFGVVRRYCKGPVAEMRVLVELNASAEGGTRLVYEVWAKPKNLLGLLAIPLQIGRLSAKSFRAALYRYDQEAQDKRKIFSQPASVNFAPGGVKRLRLVGEKLIAQGANADLVRRLVLMIEQGDDLVLARLRPHALADAWGASRRAVLELCLCATRAGLLDLQWDLLCPLCRGSQQQSASLRDIEPDVHCDSCNIDFTVNFDRSIELTFRPNPYARRIESQDFCIGGPEVTPHIRAQQLLPSGDGRTLQLPLEPGRYRVRMFGRPGAQSFQVCDQGLSSATLCASDEGWPDEDVLLCPSVSLRLENRTSDEQLFILERLAWSDQAATAAEVTALQVFRDLFASEALRPGQQIYVGSLTVLFTDLRGSTKLYREIGDATAFGRVMNHFDVLREAIAAEEGAVVKTIGDAVMAVFRRPAAALRAMFKAQKALANPPTGVVPLMLKAGLHTGPCIAVTLNERLDYFGSTVNMAARLEALSTGGDVVISPSVYADPEVFELLSQFQSGLVAKPFEVTLKGFDEERFELWRVVQIAN